MFNPSRERGAREGKGVSGVCSSPAGGCHVQGAVGEAYEGRFTRSGPCVGFGPFLSEKRGNSWVAFMDLALYGKASFSGTQASGLYMFVSLLVMRLLQFVGIALDGNIVSPANQCLFFFESIALNPIQS